MQKVIKMRKVLLWSILSISMVLLCPSIGHAVSTDTCYDTDTVIMLHMDGADGSTTITDSATCVGCPVAWTAGGNFQIDDAQYKFGQSGLNDGTNDYVSAGSNSLFDPGTSDFTVDFWVRGSSFPNPNYWFNTDWGDGIVLYESSGTIHFIVGGTDTARSYTLNAGTWYHIALTRASGTVRLFVNGSKQGADVSKADDLSQSGPYVTSYDTTNYEFPGWIDEVRFVVGTAVWTSNFTRPAAAYTECGGGGTSTYDGSTAAPISNGGFIF